MSLSMAVLNIILVLFLVLLNGFFVAAEFAMVKIRSTRVEQLINEGNRRARFAKVLVDNLDVYLSACQLGITLASLGLGWIGEPAIAEMIEPILSSWGLPNAAIHTISFIIAFSLITALHIIMGELAPKSLAIQKAEPTVLWVAAPMILFNKIMYPFIWIMNGIANQLLRAIGIEPVTEHEAGHTEEEIRILMNQSHKKGLISKTEYTMVEKVFKYTETLAKDIMVPRTEIVYIDLQKSFEQNLEIIQQENYTRYPVINGDKDQVLGMIHIKDFYHLLLQGKKDLLPIVRKVVAVPETLEINNVLHLLQKHQTEMAIVIDEYGGTAGLLTLEDIVEELVGEIQDEFDVEQPDVEKIENGYSISGRLRIEEVRDLLNVDMEHEEVDTIAGWLYTQLNKVPTVGDKVTLGNWQFEVKELDGLRISRIWVQQMEPANADPDPDPDHDKSTV